MLKFFAVLCMTIDHIGYYFGPALPPWLGLLCRLIGRMAFPIFAYQIACGYRRTGNFFYYLLRLAGFAVASQVIINYGKSLIHIKSRPNVLFTLALGLVFIIAYELFDKAGYDRLVRMQPANELSEESAAPWQFRFNEGFSLAPLPGKLLGIVFMLLAAFAASYFDTDYGAYGVLTIFLFHLSLNQPPQKQIKTALLYLSLFNLLVICSSLVLHSYFSVKNSFFYWSPLQGFSILGVMLIGPVQKKWPASPNKPPLWQKYFFYLYYPLHILLLTYLAKILIY